MSPHPSLSRRAALASLSTTLIAASTCSPSSLPAADSPPTSSPRLRFSLNTSTIMGQELSVEEEVDVAAKAGYDALEPWMGKLQSFVEKGGSLSDLRKRIEDHGLTVESAIGFAPWIVNDDAARKTGLDQLKRDMDLLKQLGGKRIAAPPVGAHDQAAPLIDLAAAAGRYRDALVLGRQFGVIPQVEVWGFSKNLSRLAESVFVALASNDPDACILPDVYHLHKGGSGFETLPLLSARAVQVFHMNDYPDSIPREKITDADRVYPGLGNAPLTAILKSLLSAGFHGVLSLELFNRDYWKQPALDVAKRGLESMQAAVAKAR